MEEQTQITGISLMAEGIEIGYVRLPADVKKNGLVWSHAVLVPRDSDYEDEIEALETSIRALLDDALEDQDLAESVDLTTEDPEEDEDE